MQNNKTFFAAFLFLMLVAVPGYVRAADMSTDAARDADVAAEMEAVSADAVAAYDASGSLFQQITDLEQEKVLMELEKERAQLDLELDRLAAEKIKLHMEIDELSGRAEQQKQELENAQAKLEAEAAKLAKEKEQLEAQTEELQSRTTSAKSTASTTTSTASNTDDSISFNKMYRLVNVIGAGTQLQATIENLDTGQTKTVSVGRTVDGYTVQSISLDDGVVFTNGDDTQMLNISKSK